MKKGPILGIDYGTKSVGIAISDEDAFLAVPLGAIRNHGQSFLVEEIASICHKEDVKKIVLGLPLNEDMSETKLAEEVRQFAELVRHRNKLEVAFEDEFLTSYQAEKILKNKKGHTKADKDAVAAQIILQNFLDK